MINILAKIRVHISVHYRILILHKRKKKQYVTYKKLVILLKKHK